MKCLRSQLKHRSKHLKFKKWQLVLKDGLIFGVIAAVIFVLVDALIFDRVSLRELISTGSIYKVIVHSILFSLIICVIQWRDVYSNKKPHK